MVQLFRMYMNNLHFQVHSTYTSNHLNNLALGKVLLLIRYL